MTSTRIIWGKWDCSNCDTKGISAEPPPGEKQPKCPHCGSPREDSEGEIPYLDNARDEESGQVLDANVADSDEELAIANAGADWVCEFCRANNRARMERCHSCGAPRTMMLASKERKSDAAPASLQPPPPSAAKTKLWRVVKYGALFFVGCNALAIWIAQTHEIPATVDRVRWEHSAALEEFTPAVKGGWKQELRPTQAIMPINGLNEIPGVMNLRNCTEKFHHNERYQCGTERVCRTRTRSVQSGESCRQSCSTSSNANGSFTESCREVCTPNYRSESYEECGNEAKYCERPIRQTWCDFDTFEWREKDKQMLSGTTLDTQWSTLTSGANQRIQRKGVYEVVVKYGDDGKEFVVRPQSEEEFKKWRPGSKAFVIADNLGTVEQALREDQIEAYRKQS